MSKPIANNKIIYQNIYGRIAEHDNYLNQGVKNNDSPTFANLQLTGDASIGGNLYVYGNTSILNTNIVEVEDNILLLNRLETGAGVTLNQSGIEIERGTLENYRFVYNESDSTLKAGVISNLKPVAIREDSPISNGIMMWNNTTKQIESRNTISIDTYISSTTQSTGITNGALVISGGLGINKDIYSNGKIYFQGQNNLFYNSIYSNQTTNNLEISSVQNINLLPANGVNMPFNKSINFGSTSQSISANSANNDININGSGHVNFNLNATKRINIPNQIPITFSTSNEKIYADGLNNMVITGQQDIQLNPGVNSKVLLPVDIPISFYNSNQKISANLNNDLNIVAGNNINLTPGALLNVCIPVNSGIRFGSTGLQRINSNSNNELLIGSTSDLKLNPGTYVTIPVNKFITFGNNYNQYVSGDTFGNLNIDAGNQVQVLCSKESTNYNNGSFIVYGGVGVGKNLNVNGNITCNGDLTVIGTTTTINTETLLVKDNLVVVNSGPYGSVDGGLLVKRYVNGTDGTDGINYAGMIYKEADDEMIFAYTDQSGANLSGYVPLRTSRLHLTNSLNVTNISNASLATPGGVYVGKDIIINGVLYNTTSNLVNISSENIDVSNITSSTLFVKNGLRLVSNNSTSLLVSGGATINGQVNFVNTAPSISSNQGGVVMSGGLSINCTTNSSGYTNGGALTVSGGASFGGDVWILGDIKLARAFQIEDLIINSTRDSTNLTTGALLIEGGITIKTSKNSVSITNGGALTIAGGTSIGLDAYVGGNINIKNNLVVQNSTVLKNNVFFESVTNDTSNNLWTYLGLINDRTTKSYSDIDFVNGDYSIKLNVYVNEPSCTAKHSSYGSSNGFKVYIYKTAANKVHIFTLTPGYSTTYIRVNSKLGNSFVGSFANEGYGSTPSGTISGYLNTWTQVYTTSNSNSLDYSIGNLTVEGTSLRVVDNMPVVGYNSTSSKDLGLIFQRYQTANDTGLGEIVTDAEIYIDTLPNQSTVNSTQVKFSNNANSTDNYYVGWWIKVTSGTNINQVRKITSYNGAQRVAQIESAWTTQNPSEADTIAFYNTQHVSLYFDYVDKKFKASYMYLNENDQTIVEYDYVDLSIKRLDINDTRPSINSFTGSIVSKGGVAISNTVDSSNSTQGGALTIAGGASINKNLYVGNGIGIGDKNIAISEALHIAKNVSSIRLENTTGSYSYVDFVENGSNKRFGILRESELFSLTCSTNNTNPYDSIKSITITTNGNVGINTTSNISSPLTIKSNNYISTDSNSEFIGIKGGSHNGNNSNVASRINLYGNSHSTKPGDIHLYSGNVGGTNGSICFSTDNAIERMRIGQAGNVYIYSTENTKSSTTGALIVGGGIAIQSTENSSDISSGGALTVGGGVSIRKDLFIGGDLFVTGSVVASGAASTPTITFSNLDNCSILSTANLKLVSVSNEAILSFNVKIVPVEASKNCQFQFSVPDRSNVFTDRGDIIITASGYTDDTNIIPLFNIIGVGVIGSTRGLVKLQSVSTATHYINIICRYTGT
jgi:hypothetical protein